MDLVSGGGGGNLLSPLLNLPLELAKLLLSINFQRYTPKTSKTFLPEYDYIIVGGGSGGSTLAGRLSEIPCVNVLLLEAGGTPPELTEVPVLARFFWFTDIDWQYKTEPQKYTGRGLVNRSVVWPSGKALGGSSILNTKLYVRGNRKNYDDWAAQGATGWSYKDVFPYFIKMEDNQDEDIVQDGFHGVGGPVTVKRPAYDSELKKPLLLAADQLGYKVVDINAFNQTGFYVHQATIRNGQRCSAAKAYLVPAEDRPNLDIVVKAFVQKVIIKHGRAIGVRFDYDGSTYEVKARREVIMSAGTVNSAQLLILSGVGPRETLEKFNIPVHADLPVGKNLHDHPTSLVNFELKPSFPTLKAKLLNPINILKWVLGRSGIYASTEAITLMTFLRGLEIRPEIDFPTYTHYFVEGSDIVAKKDFGLTDEVYKAVYGPYEDKPFYFCAVSLIVPKSRGYVSIRSTNPYDQPVIDPNYLEDPEDVKGMLDGMKNCLRIGNTAPMRKLGSRPFPAKIPGCEEYEAYSDPYLICVLRTAMATLSHQVGTNKMGDPADPTTVVDPLLRVKGIQGLRVVDASIMPIVPSGNTNVPTMMVAEKAADIIKQTIQCGRRNG